MIAEIERTLPAAFPRVQTSGSTVLLVSSNATSRQPLANRLRNLRWTVHEASSGAEAWLQQDLHPACAVLLDDWLPDLSAREFAQHFLQQFPAIDLLSTQGVPAQNAIRGPRRNELLLALREEQAASWGLFGESHSTGATVRGSSNPSNARQEATEHRCAENEESSPTTCAEPVYALPDLLGASAPIQELAKLVRLAAPHNASILIEGETGTGKELVARAVHGLSVRSAKAFVTLNCAAIPEQLLEAELFGHTRGAFTGAVTSRTGRIEAAHGGTLFLDEIGEMPLALQAKMLRFLECGEIQRIGDNETFRVDVRIVAATHQPLEDHAENGRFRLDLYHRLAVFPVNVPPLRERKEDLPMLVQHTLRRLGQGMPQRSICSSAMEILHTHDWPGNVRELLHVLQRAVILCGDDRQVREEHVRLKGRRCD